MQTLRLNKTSIRLIILLSSLSLIGLITTQVFWIDNAYKLADQQFDNRVTIALQGALDEYVQLRGGERPEFAEGCLPFCSVEDSMFINLIPAVLDSLLHVHFNYHGLDSDFGYKVVRCESGETLYHEPGNLQAGSRLSSHRISLSCLQHPESHHLEVIFGSRQFLVLRETLLWLIASVIFLLIVIFSFAYIVTTIIRQKKISEIRNDFINNMTHEFKTPIANISLAAEVLKRKETRQNEAKTDQYLHIIRQENQRMKSQVERVLQVAVRNRDDLTVKAVETDIHDLIEQAVDHACFQDCREGASVRFEFEARHPILHIDPMHFSNIVHNLIENAQKYADQTPEIVIRTRAQKDKIHISFEDNGIGIPPDAQKHIFEKFYRVPTGNVHNVKGFGLGLNYVKTMTEAMGGSISLTSEPGKGSCFTLVFRLT